ncbi:MAG: phosphatase PAP2 family protein [Ignavibacteria bacterium]|nr:phosphatase PAP2 family protein [Ignavibacteria bacterium]
MDFLYSIDRAIFLFLNQTLSNPLGDVLWPLITDYDKLWPVRIVLGAVWLWLLIRGGRQGRTVAITLVLLLFLSDKLSSSVIKEIVGRPRPCHEMNGLPIMQSIHLLVDCGSGKSFPSSHAVNNFAVATLFTFYYRRWMYAFLGWAFLVALSRPAVGVHYPSDILAGALIGAFVGAFLIWVWLNIERRFFPAFEENASSKVET